MILLEDTVVNATSATLLTCVGYSSGYNVPVPSVTWSKDGTVLINGSRLIIRENVVIEHRVVFVKSTIEICPAEFEDTGNYSCTADIGTKNDSATTELTVADLRGKGINIYTVVFSVSSHRSYALYSRTPRRCYSSRQWL